MALSDLPMAEVGLHHRGVAAHLTGQSVGDARAVVHDQHVVGQLHDELELVLDQQDRLTA